MSDTQALLIANQDFYRAFAQKNLDGIAAAWSKGMDCICIHPGRPPLKGWDQIQESWDQIFKSTESFQLGTDILAIDVSENLGYVAIAERLVQVIEGKRIELQSLATNVFQNIAGNWYLVHRHSSPILPVRRPDQPPGPGDAPPQARPSFR